MTSESCDSCQHVGAINKDEVEECGKRLVSKGDPVEFKKDGPFLIISAVALASEEVETTVIPTQSQLQQDNDSSGARSYLKQVFIVKCTSCDKSIAALVKGKYQRLHELLHRKEKPDGWIEVKSDADHLTYFILSQIIYREYEMPIEDELQVEYALPCDSDILKILWVTGHAAGFYSIKPKGTFNEESMECYSMTVLDSIFIRDSFRRKGYATSAIQDIIEAHPNENIGLSVPISLPMKQVVKKHLETCPDDRMKIWEIAGCGSEGNCQILWYALAKRQRCD